MKIFFSKTRPRNLLVFIGTYISCVIVCVAVVFSSEASACPCAKRGTLESDIAKHDVIFVGQVMDIKPAGLLRPGYNLVRFMPMKTYKGKNLMPNLESVTVFTPDTEKECGISFNKRIDYVVFASGNPAFLKVNNCTRTDVQENAKAMLVEMEKIIR